MLQETKSSIDNLDILMARLWRGIISISIDSLGDSSGLTISSNPEEVELENFLASRHSISAHFHPLGTNLHGLITYVYVLKLPDHKI